jgi:NAD-dependent dihydropyrimidine dehydrogenase PreA subunit
VKEKRNKKAIAKIESIIRAIDKRKKTKIFSPVDYPPFPFVTFNMPRYGYRHFLKIYNDDTHFVVDTARCNQCKKCEQFCPVYNIYFTTEVKWKHENCQLCLACYNCCPNQAIQYIDHKYKVNTHGKNQYWNY